MVKKKPSILIVDDVQENLYVLEKILKKIDAEVIKATSGNQALVQTLNHDFALIILDVQMPEMDGFEVAEILRHEEKTVNVPIVFITAIDHSDTKEIKGYQTGAVDFIYKPFNELILLSKVKVFLEWYEMKTGLRNLVSEKTIQLKESESKYRSIFEDAIEGIFQVNIKARILNVNPAMVRILGFHSKDEFMNEIQDFAAQLFVIPDDYKTLRQTIEKKGFISHFECQMYRRDLSIIWVSLKGRVVLDDKDAVSHIQGLAEDITDKKKAELALQRAYEEMEARVEERTRDLLKANKEILLAKEAAEAANQAKSIFLANMSHEIRTPLNGVIATTELALSEDINPKLERYLKIVQSSGITLLGVINEILDFSKIEAGKLELENRLFDLDQLLISLIDMFVGKASEKQIDFWVDIEPNVPLILVGDGLRLQQIFSNLLSNAIKFTGSKGFVGISIQAEFTGEDTVLLNCMVSDTGIGINQDYLEKLFVPFSQQDASTTRKYGGTGLGLTITKRLIEMMGGTIHVESEVHKGSQFKFAFEFNYKKNKQRIEDNKFGELPRALILDTNVKISQFIERMLNYSGFNVDLAVSEEELNCKLNALTKTEKNYQLILIDVDFITKERENLIKTIRIDYNIQSPLLLMTTIGKSTLFIRNFERELGQHAVISKPFIFPIFQKVINDLFSQQKPIDFSIQKPLAKTTPYFNGCRALIVEDNVVNQSILQAILERARIEVEIANNGRQAVDAVKRSHFDAVLMDVQMPEMDGHMATFQIRQWENNRIKNNPSTEFSPSKRLPIIAMTAHALKGDEEKCLEAGMDAYVTKPINQERLFTVLAQYLSHTNQIDTHSDDLIINQQALPVALPGINIQQALNRLNLSPSVFKSILLDFRKSFRDILTNIHNAFENKQWATVQSLVHSLKGSAGNIEASDLYQLSQALENKVSEERIDDAIYPLFQELTKACNEVITSLDILESTHSDQTKDISIANSIEQSQSSLIPLIQAFDHYLYEADPIKIDNTFDSLKAYMSDRFKVDLEHQIEQYDWESARNTLCSWVHYLKMDIDISYRES
ncbi:MAG: response regulator [Desulfobacterales bacterium]|nr:response regulator [Desulfobacterales bacterium]